MFTHRHLFLLGWAKSPTHVFSSSLARPLLLEFPRCMHMSYDMRVHFHRWCCICSVSTPLTGKARAGIKSACMHICAHDSISTATHPQKNIAHFFSVKRDEKNTYIITRIMHGPLCSTITFCCCCVCSVRVFCVFVFVHTCALAHIRTCTNNKTTHLYMSTNS